MVERRKRSMRREDALPGTTSSRRIRMTLRMRGRDWTMLGWITTRPRCAS